MTATYVGVLLFYVLYFFRPEDFIPALSAVPFAKITGLFTGVTLIGAILSGRVRLILEIKLLIALFAYLCLCIPGSLWPGGSFDAVINGFSKIVLVVVATMCAVSTVARLRRVIFVQIFAMFTMALLAFGKDRQAGRMFGVGMMFDDPNDLALNLCIILPFCVALLLSSRSRLWKVFWTLTVAVTLLAIVSTYSRGGFLALAAVLLTMWHRFSIRARTALFLLVIVILPTAAILAVGKSSYFERMGTIIDTEADTSGSAQIRREILKRSLEVTVEHPIWGVGPGQFDMVSGSWHQTHNSYTQLSSEAGIPALIIFLMLIRRSFNNLRLLRTTAERSQTWYLAGAVYCALVGYLVGAFFLSAAYWLVPYLLVAYVSALRSIREASNTSVVEHFPKEPILT